MAAPRMKTEEAQKAILGSLKDSFEKKSIEPLEKWVLKWSESESDAEYRKLVCDQVFREYLTGNVIGETSQELPHLRLLCELSISGSKGGISSPTLPIVLLSDMFDVIPLEKCQELFSVVEGNVQTWKDETFFVPCKNSILRICNDLLRRLSRTQNTVFCGRILLFLAKFFPFSERSGLNVISEFNLDNTTVFSDSKTQDDSNGHSPGEEESMEVTSDSQPGEGTKNSDPSKDVNIDYTLYIKFWQLQDYFRNPTQCYEKLKWKTFSTYTKDVLNIFQSYKLDSISGRVQTSQTYFAKYLTNQNLFQLQLGDSNFRQYILIQFLILFQYLQSSVKFKSESQVLSEEQKRWISGESSRIYGLLEETPPNGKEFAESVRHILKREEQWSAWKNEGCPSFVLKPKEEDGPGGSPNQKKPSTRKAKRKLGDQIRDAERNKKFLMGNVHLTKLWNLFPDNMEACSSEERDFLPSLDDYFSEAIEQMDPANQIEDDYKKVNDGAWGWRALRLLARKSPNFFTYGNKPIARLPDYLESMLKQMSKDDSPLKKVESGKNGHEDSNGSGAPSGGIEAGDSQFVENEADS